jgi:hypothetical protein
LVQKIDKVLSINTTPMSEQNILDHLSLIDNIEDRIECLSTFDLQEEHKMFDIIYAFDIIKDSDTPFKHAMQIGDIIINKIGLIIIERESSYSMNKFITIMDELKRNDDFSSHWIFKYTFEKMGFKYAHECDNMEMYELYILNDQYEGFKDDEIHPL